jgi:hypothetical protein
VAGGTETQTLGHDLFPRENLIGQQHGIATGESKHKRDEQQVETNGPQQNECHSAFKSAAKN